MRLALGSQEEGRHAAPRNGTRNGTHPEPVEAREPLALRVGREQPVAFARRQLLRHAPKEHLRRRYASISTGAYVFTSTSTGHRAPYFFVGTVSVKYCTRGVDFHHVAADRSARVCRDDRHFAVVRRVEAESTRIAYDVLLSALKNRLKRITQVSRVHIH